MKSVMLVMLRVAMLLLAVSPSTSSSELERVEVEFGKHKLSIPRKLMREPRLSQVIANPNQDDLLDFTVYLNPEVLADEIPGYQAHGGKYRRYRLVYMEALTPDKTLEELRSYTERFSRLWLGHGHSRKRVIEQSEASGFYKVYYPSDMDDWSVLRERPNSEQPMPDPSSTLVARCFSSNPFIMNPGLGAVCDRRFIYDDVEFLVRFNEVNLHVADEIEALVIRRFQSWKVQE